jgi:hypothetical protein
MEPKVSRSGMYVPDSVSDGVENMASSEFNASQQP